MKIYSFPSLLYGYTQTQPLFQQVEEDYFRGQSVKCGQMKWANHEVHASCQIRKLEFYKYYILATSTQNNLRFSTNLKIPVQYLKKRNNKHHIAYNFTCAGFIIQGTCYKEHKYIYLSINPYLLPVPFPLGKSWTLTGNCSI